jgi:hypothetical protein
MVLGFSDAQVITMRTLVIFLAAAMVCTPAPALAQTPELDAAADRAIIQVAGDLYRFRSGSQHSLFLVTRDGIVVVDPLGLYAASWLNQELRARFPNTRVRYVVLTHHHAERAGGAGVLKPERIVAHESFRSALSDTSSRISVDYRYVIAPQTTFQDRHTITVGGQTIDLIHALRSSDLVRWLGAIAGADADTVMFGDGTTMTRDRLAALAEYFGAMRSAVLDGYDRGRSLGSTIDTVRLEAHRTSAHYAGRTQQITDMYRQVRFRRGDIILSGIANYLPEQDSEFCSGYQQCASGGIVPAGTASASLSLGRRFGIQVEVALSEQFYSSRAKPLYDEETALRLFMPSVLMRFNLTRSRSVSLLAGVTSIFGDVKGLDRVQGVFIPTGGRHAIAEADRRTGFTGGLELSQRVGAVRLVVPLRVTSITGDRPDFWPGRLNASAGLGLAIPFFRVLE